MIINNDINQKYLSKEKLIELINSLPEGSILIPNKVGNITIYDNENDCNYSGYIDFLFEGEICNFL